MLEGVERTTLVNKALASVLKGAYKQEGFTLPTLAEQTKIPLTTLQRIMAGKSPVTMGELETIAVTVKIPAVELFESALKKADRDELSVAPVTNINTHTKPAKDAVAELPDGVLKDLPNAAKRKNTELGRDEPQTP